MTSSMNKDERDPRSLNFPVVGIGASAGGLAAVQHFFENMPPQNGMAFVIILHLSPSHESTADLILQRSTPMPVTQVRSRTQIQPDHVYVIPPTNNLIMEDGHLALADRAANGPRAITIDVFFRTLAEAHRQRAICIVLSGMGSDGAFGLTQVKAAGGLTLAQSPDEAEYESMPIAAIATGEADIVLPVADMPQALIELWTNARQIRLPADAAAEINTLPEGDATAAQEAEEALKSVLSLITARTQHDFRHYKRATILRRLERRLQVRALPDLPSYLDYLTSHSDETALLLQDLLISVTNFFRDRSSFDALEREVISQISAGLDQEPIRAWVAGCATGEEAYSLSILLQERIHQFDKPKPVQIFATDIDERALAFARHALYPTSIINDISPARLQNYFVKEEDQYRLKKTVREPILFALHNILRDPPFSRLDIVCCRNLLIYLDRDAQRQVLETFHFALKPNGWLFLGNSETEDAASNLFSVVDKKNRIYRANPRTGGSLGLPTRTFSTFSDRSQMPATTIPDRRRVSFLQIHQQAVQALGAPSVLIDRDYNILHISEHASPFLQRQGGEPSHQLLLNIQSSLRIELRTALFKAVQTGENVDTPPLLFLERALSIGIRHYQSTVGSALLLVMFNSVSNTIPTITRTDEHSEMDLVVNYLESQIVRYQEDLQSTLERAEVSTEELKASNEELQAINEELRSATEELETGKEELQSMNEELIALNYELQNKIEESDSSNDYLHNLIGATDIATIVIDKELHVMRFTPRAKDLFKLIPNDTGRSLTDIRHELDYTALVDDIYSAFHDLKAVERKVRGLNRKYYLARTFPFRTQSDRIEGAVLTFIDITALQTAEEQVRLSEERLRLAAETTKDYAIIMMDETGVITTWNAGAESTFGYAGNEIIGKTFDLLFSPEDRLELEPKRELERARATNKSEDERWYVNKDGQRFFGSGVTTPLRNETHEFVKIVRDRTRSRHLEIAREAQLNRERNDRDQMQATDRMKDEFLAVLSHELKHPLNLININAELLSHLPEARESSAVLRAAETIRRTVRSQAKIIDDLLDLSRARTGKLTLSLSAVVLDEAIFTIIGAAKEEAKKKNIELTYQAPSVGLTVECDRVRVEQILWNLISNAVKFTPEGGRITVALEQDHRFAKLSVIDTGVGISSEHLHTVFDMFNQGNRGTTAEGGMGIGLALVRELVAALRGRVEAKSAGKDQGAEFSVWMPLVVEPSKSDDVDSSIKSDILEGLRILLVDDSVESLTAMAEVLKLLGSQVEIASAAVDALKTLEANSFDVVISDIGMPQMDGYQLITEIRRHPYGDELVAIAVTGYGRDQDAQRALAHGFNAHLSKPVSVEDIQKTITKLKKRHS